MRVIFLGSGAFGGPTLKTLMNHHDVVLVVTQPDRPAGRRRVMTPTPIARFASANDIDVIKPEIVNEASVINRIHAASTDVMVIVAYGQKLGSEILEQAFAMNLHASLLPKYRGAAPINWAIMNGEIETGLSVITIAERIDSGDILAQLSTPIDPMESAGELEERLSQMGGRIILQVIDQVKSESVKSIPQEESMATHARKLTKSDGTVDFNQPATNVRNRIHGLTPWPGCTVRIGEKSLRLGRVRTVETDTSESQVGAVLPDFTVACATGTIEILSVQPPGGKLMSFDAYRRGHSLTAGLKFSSL